MNSKEQALRFLQLLFTQCHQNEALKQALLKNPIKTLEKLTGKPNNRPKEYAVIVEDQSNPDCIYFNIPAKTNNNSR